jgi:hypothetical protein
LSWLREPKTAAHVKRWAMNSSVASLPAFSWWSIQRLRFNLLLLAAAPVSAVSLFVVWWLFDSRLPCLEITGFSLLAGCVLFFVGLALANLCYFLAPLSEKLLRPLNVYAFRRIVFGVGVGFSLLLVFAPVIGNLVAAALGPSVSGQCHKWHAA